MEAETRSEIQFEGSEAEFEAVLAKAASLQIQVEIVDRQKARGVSDVVLQLLLAGAAEVIGLLLAEFASVLKRGHSKKNKRKR